MTISFPELGTSVLDIPDEFLSGKVINRHNRFMVEVGLGDEIVMAHLHDPGRLNELIFPGSSVKLRKIQGKKTNYSIISAKSSEEDVLLDTRFHSKIAKSFLTGSIKQEVTISNSRFDFVSDGMIIEIKGVSLVKDGVLKFPDAVTERGRKHISELLKLHKKGSQVAVIFLCFSRHARAFSPNFDTDPKFAEAFVDAYNNGVKFFFPKLGFDNHSLRYYGLITQIILGN